MRSFFLALLLALPLVSPAQRSGTYGSVAWSISESNALLWGGQPYVPVGAVIDATPEAVKTVSDAGIKDVIVDTAVNGSGLEQTAARLEEAQMRYLVRVNSLAPLAPGVAIEPQSYRVSGITGPRSVVVRLPGTKSALVVLASTRDAYIEKVERVEVRNDTLTVDVRPKSEMEHVLLIYPMTVGIEMPDFWEGLDLHRDRLISTLRSTKLGSGLRGIINPLGRTMALPGRDFDFVPSSPAFRLEFAQHLENRYRSVLTAMRSWSMNASDFTAVDDRGQPKTTFNDLSRLIPLWSGSRGLPQLWDPQTDKLYPVDNKRSTIWKDIVEVVNVAGVRRFDRLVGAIRSSVNVPVIQEWAGWAAPYEGTRSPLDGIGMRVSGTTPDQLIQSASRPTSTVLRWPSGGWLLATSISDSEVSLATDQLGQIGARGFFFESKTPEALQAIAAESTRRTADLSFAQVRPSTVFFPENAANPATPQKLPGGSWWLPTPADGNRILLGPNYKAYRMNLNGVRTFVIWTRKPGRVLLRMAKPDTARFRTIDGSDPQPKLTKKGVEVLVTDSPLIIQGTDEIPVPDDEVQSLLKKFGKMLTDAQAAHRDATEERMAFEQAGRSFEQNPGGSYPTMLDQYYRAAQKLGTFTWIEAERVQDTNFSEAISLPAASNGGALSLRTTIPPESTYFSEYLLPVRSTEEQTVWLAAKIPVEQRKNVQALIGGQTLTLADQPINGYADGFAWYKLGTTRLAGGSSKIRITVVAPDGADLALDAILLTPTAFVPNGVVPPDLLAD